MHIYMLLVYGVGCKTRSIVYKAIYVDDAYSSFIAEKHSIHVVFNI